MDETELNILYNVLWDYTWTINTSGEWQNTTFYIMYCDVLIVHELLIHQGETEHNIIYNVLWDYTWTINSSETELHIICNVLWDYTWTINTSGERQNTTLYIMYCVIIHELLIHQDETEHNIPIWCTVRLVHELLIHQDETVFYIMYCEIIHELLCSVRERQN